MFPVVCVAPTSKEVRVGFSSRDLCLNIVNPIRR
jgi:hypothetical protein